MCWAPGEDVRTSPARDGAPIRRFHVAFIRACACTRPEMVSGPFRGGRVGERRHTRAPRLGPPLRRQLQLSRQQGCPILKPLSSVCYTVRSLTTVVRHSL